MTECKSTVQVVTLTWSAASPDDVADAREVISRYTRGHWSILEMSPSNGKATLCKEVHTW